MNKSHQNSVINFINHNNLTGIKAGEGRADFLNIWMVVVEERIFARSWGLHENSWYTAFLMNPNGTIKCGEIEHSIIAKIPSDNQAITKKINGAYLKKYDFGENSVYAKGIVQKKHMDRTMEFIVIEN